MARTLTTASRLHSRQRQLSEEGLREARRFRFAPRQVIRIIRSFQAQMVDLTVAAMPRLLEEQGVDPTASGRVVREALLSDPQPLGAMLARVNRDAADILRRIENPAFDQLVSSIIEDAARSATQVDASTREAVTVFVRYVGPNCCARCAILAGREYRFSTGFERHPQCTCTMVPTTVASDLRQNPMELFREGRIRGLSRAETRALNEGADISRLVNVRSRKAGLMEGSSVLRRSGKLTPAGIYRVASDQDEVQRLMRRYGYVR